MIDSPSQDYRVLPGLLPMTKGMCALDLGCGTGLYAQELARRGGRVVGIDLKMKNLQEARSKTGEFRILWVRADAARLPFRGKVFDTVVSVEMLTHLDPEKRMEVLFEMSRVSCIEGRSFVTFHNRARLSMSQWIRLRRPMVVYETSNLKVWPTVPVEAKKMACACGLRDTDQEVYLNYHSRFSYGFSRKHPVLSQFVILIEDLLQRLPLFRRLGITFLLSFRREQ